MQEDFENLQDAYKIVSTIHFIIYKTVGERKSKIMTLYSKGHGIQLARFD